MKNTLDPVDCPEDGFYYIFIQHIFFYSYIPQMKFGPSLKGDVLSSCS